MGPASCKHYAKVKIFNEHRLGLQDGRRYSFFKIPDLVEDVSKDDVKKNFRSLLNKGDKSADDLLNKIYNGHPAKLSHVKHFWSALDIVQHTKKSFDDYLIQMYFFIDRLATLLERLNLTTETFPKEQGISLVLMEGLIEGKRTNLYTALLVVRIINRLRHDAGMGWFDPRHCILSDIRRSRDKLTVMAVTGSILEKTPYEAWNPLEDLPARLEVEDEPNKGQAPASFSTEIRGRSHLHTASSQ